MADKFKLKVRTLQAETGWSYSACRNLLREHEGDYERALADANEQTVRKGRALGTGQ
jgi:hypothetical protein